LARHGPSEEEKGETNSKPNTSAFSGRTAEKRRRFAKFDPDLKVCEEGRGGKDGMGRTEGPRRSCGYGPDHPSCVKR